MQTNDPAELVREHQEEIQRRRAVANAEQIQDTFENASSVCSLPAKNPDQTYVVFSLSNEKFAPRMRPGECPAVRIYGAFASRDEARSYATDLSDFDPGISLLVDEVHKWILAPRNESRLNDASLVDKKLKRHGARLEREREEFAERQARPVEAAGGGRSDAAEPPDAGAASQAREERRGGRHAVPALYQLADQRLAVVSFVCDDSSEFLFKVYGLVDSPADANAWVRNVLSKQVKDHHIDVVATCQWCYPTTMKAERVDAEAFRNKELDAIMNHHKREPSRVKEFSEWYATQEPPASNSTALQIREVDDGRNDDAGGADDAAGEGGGGGGAADAGGAADGGGEAADGGGEAADAAPGDGA